MKYNKITVIKCYNQINTATIIDSNDEPNQDIDLIQTLLNSSDKNYFQKDEDIDLSDHSTDQEVADEMKCKETCGNYSNDSEIHTNNQCSCKLKLHYVLGGGKLT